MVVGRNRFARQGPLRIAYELCGPRWRRAPWLVLIQGLGFDRTGWAPIVPALRRRFRLVLIDNRGTGRSTAATGQIRAATLVMYGDANAVVDPRNSKLLASRIPDSQLAVFPRLGHLFFWEDPASFVAAVTSFLLSLLRAVQRGYSSAT